MEVTDEDLIREPEEDRRPYVTTTWGLRGFFAVLMHYDDGWEPWQSGIGSYRNAEGAAIEGRDWALAEELEFRP